MAGGAHRLPLKSRFYKLIWPGMARDRQLAVPKLFAKEYGHRLSGRVVFKLPNGAEWPIRLSGSGDKIWFSEGWRQFADFYSVTSPNYFLVFEYLGDSRFLVLIFDPSASEISYPPSNVTETGQEPPLNNGSRSPELEEGLASGSSSETTPDEELPSDSSQEPEGSGSSAVPFTSVNPFFTVTVAPGHLPYGRGSCRVRIPNGFTSFIEKDAFDAELWIEGTYWPVKLLREIQKGNEYINMGAGWRRFAVENSVQVGEVCVFELIGIKEDGMSKTMKFNVKISK